MAEAIETNALAIAELFTALANAIENPEPMLRRTQALLAADEEEAFATEGRSLGASWAPTVDPSEGAGRLLVNTGALMQSVTSPSAGTVEGNTLSFGTDVPYAAYLEFGTSRMVARPFLGVTEKLVQAVEELLTATIEEHFAE